MFLWRKKPNEKKEELNGTAGTLHLINSAKEELRKVQNKEQDQN